MVNNVVVATEHAFTVRTFSNGFHQRFGCGLLHQNIARPFPVPAIESDFAVEINFYRVIRARIAYGAINAPRRAPFWRIFLSEIFKRTERTHGKAPFIQKPSENVEVVATLLQYHRRFYLVVSPITAHKTVRLMPIPHVFQRVHRNGLSYCPA